MRSWREEEAMKEQKRAIGMMRGEDRERERDKTKKGTRIEDTIATNYVIVHSTGTKLSQGQELRLFEEESD